MVATHLTHDILCIGSHAPREHDFHAANARAICGAFTGGQGPSRLVSTVLAGPRVTRAAVATALEASGSRAAKNYVFYFSGRANPLGFEVSDGTISAEMFARHVAHVRARAMLLLLDLSIGAQPDHALLPRWLRAIATSRPGTRVVAARATRIGTGARGAGLTRFTSAFVSALETARGDVRMQRSAFISDKRAMEETRRLLSDRWGVTHLPLELGTFGDMPLIKSQAAAPIGRGLVEAIVVAAGGISASVAWVLEGRANMHTTLHYSLEDADGSVVAEGSTAILASHPLQKGKVRVSFPRRILGPRANAGGSLDDLAWRVSLRDVLGRVLGERIVEAS